MKKINILQIILSIIALCSIIALVTIFIITLPNSISKYLILFYLIALGIDIFNANIFNS